MSNRLVAVLGLLALAICFGMLLYAADIPHNRGWTAISWKQCLTKCESQGCAFEAWTPDMCICGEGCISEPAE